MKNTHKQWPGTALATLIMLGCGEDGTVVMARRLHDGGSVARDALITDVFATTETEVAEDGKTPLFCDFEPDNAVMNGSFEFQPFESCGWSVHDTSDWGLRTTVVCDDAGHSSCALQIEPRIWGDPWIAQLFQTVQVRKGQAHFICFEARAVNKERSIEVAMIGAGDPMSMGNGITISLAHEWRNECLQFTATAWSDNSVLVFAVAGSSGAFLLDNVSVSSGDASTSRTD